jgi:uncharacterized BrkB/YihY/UPF0761 family membrane protein
VVALIWGASRFVVSFEDAIARVMGGDRRRGLLARNLGAVGAVILMIAALLGGTVLAGLAAFLEAGQAAGVVAVVTGALSIALGFVPIVVVILAIALVYRLVPIPAPPWRAIAWPAVGVGIALTILGRVFVYLAPRLIGSAALLGTLTTAFAALAWLALSFPAVLIGAAWVRVRADRIMPAGAAQIPASPRPTEPSPD